MTFAFDPNQHDDHCWFKWDDVLYKIARIKHENFYLYTDDAWQVINWPAEHYKAYADQADRLIKEVQDWRDPS